MLNCAGPWRIGGASLVALAEVGDDLQPLAGLLAGFAAAPDDGQGWRVVLLRRAPRALAAGAGLRHATLISGEPFDARFGRRSRWFLVDGRLRLAIDPGRKLAVCRLGQDGGALLRGESGLMLLDAVVEQQGQHMLHAALLALPPALGEGGILLLGDSGAGKTTTSLALSLGGYALAGDDTAILCPAPDGVAAWALPRRLKVHREVAGLLPSLAPDLPQDREERVYEPTSLAGLSLLRPADRLLPLSAICWLGPRSAGEHRATPLSPIEMLARLAAADLHAPRALVDRGVEGQLALFASAARRVPGFELSLGRDLPALPAWLGQVLGAGLS